jgi:hypothetical protein
MSFKRLVFWNCAGGVKSKMDFIKNYIDQHHPCALFISEAEIKSHDLNLLRIKNYDLIVSNTIDKGAARQACYIKSSINYNVVKTTGDCDIVAIETQFDRAIGVYRGFKLPTGVTKISFFHSLMTSLKLLCQTNKILTIGGDFNVDLNKKTSNLHDLDNWSIRFGLDQLVKGITRQRIVNAEGGVRVESSSIDHLYTNSKDWKLIITPSISDHHLIEVHRAHTDRSPRQKIQVRDWRHYSKELANETINNKINQISDLKSDYSSLVSIYNDTLNQIAPIRTVRIQEGQIVSTKIEALKKRRDRYLRKYKKSRDIKHLELAKSFSNTIKRTVKSESKRLFQLKAKSPNPKHFWEALNDKMGSHKEPISFLVENGQRIDDDTQLANILCTGFNSWTTSILIIPRRTQKSSN